MMSKTVKVKPTKTKKPKTKKSKGLSKKNISWIANNDPHFWLVPRKGVQIEVDCNTPITKLTKVVFHKSICNDYLTNNKNSLLFEDLKKCLIYLVDKEYTTKFYRLSNICNDIIRLIKHTNERRYRLKKSYLISFSQITQSDVIHFIESFKLEIEDVEFVTQEVLKLNKRPIQKDWDQIFKKTKLYSSTYSIIKQRLLLHDVDQLQISNKKNKREFFNKNKIIELAEITHTKIKTVRNVLINVEYLFSSKNAQANPINFTPTELFGSDYDLECMFNNDNYNSCNKTPIIPLNTSLFLILESLKFCERYGKALHKYLLDIDTSYLKLKSELNYSWATLYARPELRVKSFMETEQPQELKSLKISILGMAHEKNTNAAFSEKYLREGMGLTFAIRLYIAAIYMLLNSFLATRSISLSLLKRDCFEQSPLDGLFDIVFLQAKSIKTNSLELLRRPIPEVVYDHGMMFALFSEYCDSRLGLKELDSKSFLFTCFFTKTKITSKILGENIEVQNGSNKLSSDFILECIDQFCDWSNAPIYEGERWYPTPHQFRRTFAVIYFNLTNDNGLEELNYLLGHRDLEQTFHYAELSPSDDWIDEAISTISRKSDELKSGPLIDDELKDILFSAKDESVKLNLQLETMVYKTINKYIEETGKNIRFKRVNNKDIYFYFKENEHE